MDIEKFSQTYEASCLFLEEDDNGADSYQILSRKYTVTNKFKGNFCMVKVEEMKEKRRCDTFSSSIVLSYE